MRFPKFVNGQDAPLNSPATGAGSLLQNANLTDAGGVTPLRPQPRPADLTGTNLAPERSLRPVQRPDGLASQGSATDVECTTGTCQQCSIITPAMVGSVFDAAEAGHLAVAADELNYAINFGMLDSELRLAHFHGQCRQETAGFILKRESLNYSVAALQVTFASTYGRNAARAAQDGRASGQSANQERIANFAYANRLGNGNEASGDGWLYRGRGIKQLTGRSNYRDFTEGHETLWGEAVDFEASPDLLATDPKYAVRSGIWFWTHHRLGTRADGGGTRAVADSITNIVNRFDGPVGYTNRYQQMRNALDRETFKTVCFNRNRFQRNFKARSPAGNQQ